MRTQVLASSWFDSFRSDMRSRSMLYRITEGSVRAVGLSTYWTLSGIYSVSKATGGMLTACYAARCADCSHDPAPGWRKAGQAACQTLNYDVHNCAHSQGCQPNESY